MILIKLLKLKPTTSRFDFNIFSDSHSEFHFFLFTLSSLVMNVYLQRSGIKIIWRENKLAITTSVRVTTSVFVKSSCIP